MMRIEGLDVTIFISMIVACKNHLPVSNTGNGSFMSEQRTISQVHGWCLFTDGYAGGWCS